MARPTRKTPTPRVMPVQPHKVRATTKKELVLTIEYRVALRDLGDANSTIEDAIDGLRQYGAAEIIDAEIQYAG